MPKILDISGPFGIRIELALSFYPAGGPVILTIAFIECDLNRLSADNWNYPTLIKDEC